MDKILITRRFQMSNRWSERYPGNAVQVWIDDELVASEHLPGVGTFQGTPDHAGLEAQAKAYQQQYPDLKIQNDLKKTGEFRASLKRHDDFVKKNGFVFRTDLPKIK